MITCFHVFCIIINIFAFDIVHFFHVDFYDILPDEALTDFGILATEAALICMLIIMPIQEFIKIQHFASQRLFMHKLVNSCCINFIV